MKTKLTLAVCLALLLPGCVPSVNPLYTEKDLVFDPALVGVWTDERGKETWAFEKSGNKKYKLLQTDDDGRTAEFEVRLVQLKHYRFLDLYVVNPGAESDWKMNQYASFAVLLRPAHTFMKVSQIEPALGLSFLNPDWLQKLLEKDPRAIRHEKDRFGAQNKDDFRIVLTADTKELQKFILKHVNDEDAFGKPSEFMRKKENSAAGKSAH
jgi:hypothetical protein